MFLMTNLVKIIKFSFFVISLLFYKNLSCGEFIFPFEELRIQSLLFYNLFLTLSHGTRDVFRGGSRKLWDAMEGIDALYLQLDMLGLRKDDIKVMLIIVS